MLQFQFECSDEERVRADFENMIRRDTPCGKGIWGNDLLRRGIHFKECGDRIKGFYLENSEGEGTRGSPLRVSFNGRFIKKGDKCVFKVFIYPNLFQLLFMLILAVSVCFTDELIAFLFLTVIFIVFVFGYIKSIRETVAFFQLWVR